MIEDGDLLIRRMRDEPEDYQAMARWLSDPHVLEFYDGRDRPQSVDGVREHYSPTVLADDQVGACFIVYRGVSIGYVQFYPVEDGVFGMDQFIGEPALWNHGLGTRTVSLMLEYLFLTERARKVTVDPHVDNLRAIRCYEKCGFRKVEILRQNELHEGTYRDCWLMETVKR